MVSRDELMRAGLPLASSCLLAIPKVFPQHKPWGSFRLCIIGPTTEELARHTPNLLNICEKIEDPNYFLHLPIHANTNLKTVVEAALSWDAKGGAPTIFLIAISPEIDVTRTLPKSQTRIPAELLRRVNPSLAIAALIGANTSYLVPDFLVVLPDSQLGGRESNQLRRWLGQQFVEKIELLEEFRRNLFVNVSRLASKQRKLMGSQKPDLWGSPASPITPNFIWQCTACRDDISTTKKGADTISLCALSGGSLTEHYAFLPADAQLNLLSLYEGKFDAVHFRRLSPDLVNQIVNDETLAAELVSAALGYSPRCEDDIFIPREEVVLTASWSIELADRSLRGFEASAQAMGYPLRSLAEICISIEKFEAGTILSNDQYGIGVIGDGPMAGRVFRRSQNEAPGDQLSHSVFYLVSDDSEFLWRSLGTSSFVCALRCKSYGSYREPVITLRAMRESRIPWPSQRERAELLDEIRSRLKAGRDAKRLARELRRIAVNIKSALDSDEITPIGPYRPLDRDWTQLIKTVKGMRDRHPFRSFLSNDSAEAPCEVPPGPIAILMRRRENEPKTATALSLIFDIAEYLIRYDLAVHLSVLRLLDGGEIKQLFSIKDGRFRPTMGLWLELQRKARTALKARNAPENHELRAFVNTLAAGDTNRICRCGDKLVEERNNRRGHSVTPTDIDCELANEEISPVLEELLRMLGYINLHKLIFVESREVKKQTTAFQIRLLIRDNQDFARDQITIATDSEPFLIRDKEVYLEYSSPNQFISLSPWLIFGTAPKSNKEAVWFLDGIEKDRLIYKSPQMHGEKYEIKELADVDETRRLVGLEWGRTERR